MVIIVEFTAMQNEKTKLSHYLVVLVVCFIAKVKEFGQMNCRCKICAQSVHLFLILSNFYAKTSELVFEVALTLEPARQHHTFNRQEPCTHSLIPSARTLLLVEDGVGQDSRVSAS